MKAAIEPVADDCIRTLEGFKKDHQAIKDIINRFDEVMLEKASKFSVTKLEENMVNYTPLEKYESTNAKFDNFQIEFFKKFELIKSDLDQKHEEFSKEMEERSDDSYLTMK